MSHCQAIFMEVVFREPLRPLCGKPVNDIMKNPVQGLHPLFFLDNSLRSLYELLKKNCIYSDSDSSVARVQSLIRSHSAISSPSFLPPPPGAV